AADTSLSPSDRRHAATLLGGYGGKHRTAARVLRRDLLGNGAAAGFEHTMVLYELARLDSSHRVAAATALEHRNTTPLADPDQCREIARAFATTGPANHAASVSTLRHLVVDTSIEAAARHSAAETLGEIVNSPGRIRTLRPQGDKERAT
ncbi:hypothetical protein, partial [Candidatus Frankia alpina]